ncbi:TIGR04283 family arsenosugar biosynthesis glycosyltransferase [Halospina denitrificans]|nr:TIGR04283 family arsenosugar biosynthesis glycosyltransferase [Halospina denitrificans]
MDPMQLSIIMPVLNESASIRRTLEALQALRRGGHEVVLCDGGSTDGTREAAAGLYDQWVAAMPGRAAQMNAGAAQARGNLLLFLHADTLLPEAAPEWLERFWRSNRDWGRFDVRLSGNRGLFRVIGFFMNLRSRLTGICTGDQAQFVRRSLFEGLGGFAPLPLMEDVEFSGRLKQHSRPFCIPSPVVTDSRRWEANGAWRTILLMWRLRWDYWRGVPAEQLRARYYP